MPTAQHRKFDLGINQDMASYLLPEGFCYASMNVLYDKLGVARKRGAITGVGATTTYNGDHMGALTTDEGTVRVYSIGVGGNVMTAVNTASGALTGMGGANFGDINADGGRPFSHYGFMVWPLYTANFAAAAVGIAAAGGANGQSTPRTFATPASVVLTVGDKRVPCAVGDSPTTLMQVGQIIVIYSSAGALAYVGRVTRLVSTTAFEVYPTPTIAATASSVKTYNGYTVFDGGVSGAKSAYIGGKVGMSFQGRILLGNISRNDSGGADRLELFPRRCQFTSTLLEGDATGLAKYQGAVWLTNNGFPDDNYFDIPGQDPITAMSPTGFGDAVIFSAYRTFRLTGNLSTQYGDTPSYTWQVREIPNSVGCITERSMQRTPRGVIFAHDSGIYTTDGSSMQPLLYGKLTNAWRALLSGTGFKIYGSALVRGNHYYICGTSNGTLWGWLVNLDTLAWGFLGGKTTAPASWIINSAVQDPAAPSRTLALKWWDEQGAAPSMTGGQLVFLDQMFEPQNGTLLDSDTTVVGWNYTTRAYTEDSPTIQKTWRSATIEMKQLGSDATIVNASFQLDAADATFAGSDFVIPNQDTYPITGATNAAPIVVTVTGSPIGVDGWVYITGVLGNTNANGRFRVQAISGSTLTLAGSYGNGAYTSGGTLRFVDSRDITLLHPGEILDGVTAVEYKFDSLALGLTGAVEAELRGITHTWDERDPHGE